MRASACLLLCVELVGCVSNDESANCACPVTESLIVIGDPELRALKGYSAFDGNAHDYQLVVSVPNASDEPTAAEPDPVLPSSLVWAVDDSYLKHEDYADLNAAVLLTTKKAGHAVVKVSGKRLSGKSAFDGVSIVISLADPDQWAAGDERYNSSVIIDVLAHTGRRPEASACDLSASSLDALPKMPTCGACHGDPSDIATAPTPDQIAGYSDDDLMQLFTTGWKPPGLSFKSDLLKTVVMPDCVFQLFHTWQIPDYEKEGVVWKLRSMKPRTY